MVRGGAPARSPSAPEPPPESPRHSRWSSRPSIIEHWLQYGDEVEVVGTIEHRPDPQRESLPREMHIRTVRVSTAGQPLTVQLVRGTKVRK